MPRPALLALTAAVVLGADWASKFWAFWWADGWITNPRPLPLWGVALSALFVAFCLVMIRGRLIAIAGGVALGGSSANILDSALFGPVIDWVPCGWAPTLASDSMCNAADGAISISGVLLAAIAVHAIIRPCRTLHPRVLAACDRLSGRAEPA